MRKIKVLFVCMGNICRSPTAEGVFRHAVERAGLADRIYIDSAGTHDYHVGEPPDRRAQAAASQRGYDLSGLRGRQVCDEDFREFDWILAMDSGNLENLKRICPVEHWRKLRLLMDFADSPEDMDVPDPYYGGTQGFEAVLDMAEDASRGLLREIVASAGLTASGVR